MKKLIILLIFAANLSFAQFKGELDEPVDIKGGITNYNPSSFLLGFINPQNFQMNHSLNMSYSAFGSHGVGMSMYTNSMSYKFNDELNIEVDASIVNTPYNTLGDAFTNAVNGIYLSRAQLNYKPSKNFNIILQYRGGPGAGYYNPYGYGSFYNRNSFFDDFFPAGNK